MLSEEQDFVLVFGALRSGTTMLRLMLDAHSRLSCLGETDYIFDYLQTTPEGELRYDREGLEHERIFQMANISYPEGLQGLAATKAMIAQLHRPETRPVLMLHRGLGHALALNPKVKIIHLVRDPRDVASSSIGMGWAGNVYFGVDHWIATETCWQANQHRLSPDQVLFLCYETLIRNPQAELSRICAFLGMEFEPGMLNYEGSSTYSKPDPGLGNQWKRKLSPFDIGLIEAKIGPLLMECGYEPSGITPIVPVGLTLMQLWLQNRRQIWATMIERYGVIDPVVTGFARRLRVPSLGFKAQARINAKTVKHLK